MNNSSASTLGSIVSAYERFLAAADPRVEGLLLMGSPLPVTAICLFYIYFVLSLGPRLMADRKPFDLKYVLLFYNAGQTIFSAVFFAMCLRHWISQLGWGLSCRPINYELRTPEEMLSIRFCHIYFLSKISELADTVFFVLKKKHRHISLLHVFHHAAMPFSVWFGVKYHPGGNLAFFGLPNLFVHIWMYLYYLLAALGPRFQKYLWWKRHITQLQLAQFASVMLYMLIIAVKCEVNKKLLTWILAMDVAFVVLFLDFYRKTYLKKTLRDSPRSAETKGAGRSDSGTARKENGISRWDENSSEKKNL